PDPRFAPAAPVLSDDLGFELADARGDDVHELIDLFARDAEGRREPYDLAAGIDDCAPVPRLAVEPGHLALVERPAGSVGLHPLGADQEATSAYLAPDPLLAEGLLEPVAETPAHGLGVLDQVILLHDLDVGERRRARDRMRRVRAGVHVLLLGVVGERVGQAPPRDGR